MLFRFHICLPLLCTLFAIIQPLSGQDKDPTPMKSQSSQQQWRETTLAYVQQVNAFIAKGVKEGWDKVGDEPEAPKLKHLAKDAIAAVRKANKSGDFSTLRDLWPPNHYPLIPTLKKKGQSIPVVCILDDGSIVARIGTSHQAGHTIHIQGDKVTKLSEMGYFGRCPKRRFFGIAIKKGIEITDGWRGPRISFCPWPTGLEGLPKNHGLKPWKNPLSPSQIIPFPDGKKVLIAAEEGIFVLSEKEATRLLPSSKQMKEYLDESADEPYSEAPATLSMEHAAISKDGKFIAIGCQSSSHLVFNEKLELIGEIGPISSYPVHTGFSSDDSMIAFNSCHFYSGVTLGIPTKLLPGLKTDPFPDEPDKRTPLLEEGSRVYAIATRGDEFALGNANGSVEAVDKSGKMLWNQFIGSTVGDIDISPNGKTMVVSTYAGFISIYDLDAGKQSPHQIGSGGHYEKCRWIFWKDEEPLRW